MAALLLVFAGLLGLAIGSFLTVVTYRVPRHQSIVTPGSRCPACATPLSWYDNVPVLSWLVLRGRCRACGQSISVRYLALELATASSFVALAAVVGPRPALGVYLLGASVVLAGVVLAVESGTGTKK